MGEKSVWIPRGEVARAIRKLAAGKGESMTKVVGDAVNEALARLEAERKTQGGSPRRTTTNKGALSP